MKKKTGQTEMTQRNFQDAFWLLYEKNSIDKITVKDICSLAGYDRSTFYRYYADVYDILHELENQILDEVDEFVVHLVEQANNFDASQALQAILGTFARLNKYIIVLLGPHGDTEFIRKIVENLKPIWIKYFFRTNQYTAAEVDFLMEYYISGLISMYQKWFCDNNGVSIERIIQLSYQTLPDATIFENFYK
ncbi:TetR/AcrR family transcriptional regulator [Clostridium folliculivorans]|uniref:TetR family transcriptional regulator n=1 Tax=Clostridium folliculivorans TaxID=2886038 RepID=A0A9W5Y0N7_9CLOT|nr:TetR/AcrR family transcriptional regulator [Clostridium folliculivorans]GKU24445.1 TetR family transcriptional regulator [Clostridium folliculivorans]GKU30538.1 TetR family transcriptional regulator [Clostridium folliculivorans]